MKKEKNKKKRKYVRVAGYENRKPYGMRHDGSVELIASVKTGDALEVSQEDWYVPTLRTQAGNLNKKAGYRKYSISVNRVKNTVYICNNDKQTEL